MEVLEVKNLCKKIQKKEILHDISFSIHEREILGFIGPNGAGKSTTMKCIAGLYQPTSGKIIVAGHDIQKEREKALAGIGVSIEYPALYSELTGHEHFCMMARWKKLSNDSIRSMEEFSGLKDGLKRKAKYYSMGMKQRLILALSMMSKPSLLILDEPTNGLDPQAIFDLREKLLSIREEGTSILLSSHQLSEVDKLVDRVIFIKEGRLIAQHTREELHAGSTMFLLEVSDLEKSNKVLEGLPISFEEDHILLHTDDKKIFAMVVKTLVKANIAIYHVEERKQDLEAYYKQLYRG
ncbi:ABC transporter ATP-binding protein [Erysipelotrichaceae bacterium HCN-30851]